MLKRTLATLLISSLLLSSMGCSLLNKKEDAKEVSTVEQDKKEEFKWLYPAYIKKDGESKWGYINDTGKFVIEPAYDSAKDFFDNGIAIVEMKDKYGLIDKSGKVILEPNYKYISYLQENIFSARGEKTSKLVDVKGNVLYETEGNVYSFSDGLAVISSTANGDAYGYINTEGKVVIEPQYKFANDFKGDRAIVTTTDGKKVIINKSGEAITTLDYNNARELNDGTIIYEANKKYGYLSDDGKVLIEAKFDFANAFSDGFAIVNLNKYSGLINKKGEFVINPQYSGLWRVSDTLYSVAKSNSFGIVAAGYSPKALLTSDGKQLTDYKFYDLEYQKNEDIISATDENSTFFINTSGEIIKDLPKLNGIGSMKITGDLIKAEIDKKLMYLTKDGKIIWQPEDIYTLKDGITVKRIKYRPERSTLIYYPELSSNINKETEIKINVFLKDKFLANSYQKDAKSEGEFTATIDADFDVSLNKNLLSIKYSSYYYPIGAAHGMPGQLYYYIDLNTGKNYSLADLFKKDSNYTKALSDLVRKQIDERTKNNDAMIFKDSYKGIRQDHNFIITKDALKLYFTPYEIAAYAAGFVTFDIPYGDIADIIDTEGDFWKSFDKNINMKATTKPEASQTPSISTSPIENAVKNYENKIIAAINENNFSIVEPYLLKDSNLYKAQKDLVPNLNKQGIKEKLVEYSVKDIKQQGANKFKVYVDESISIQYPGADFATKQFSYIYTLVSSDKSGEYLLSEIEKWEK